MRAAKNCQKHLSPLPGALEIYNRLGDEGYEVISIHMTGKTSGTVRSAESAAQMSKTKVTVIDSQFISKATFFSGERSG